MKRDLLPLIVATALFVPGAFADQITMKNGDRLTGTIVKSDGKTLTIKLEYADAVNLPWDQVETISSKDPIYLTLKDGQSLFGAVSTSADKVEVKTDQAGAVTAAKDSIQTIRSKQEQQAYELELDRLRNPRLLDLWTGFVDMGLATTRGNAETTTFNLGMNASRATPRDKIGVYFTSLYATNSTTGTSLTTANAVRGGVSYNLNISRKTYGFGFTDLEYDQFQKLDLRFVGGGGFGYHAVKNEKTTFDLFTGGALNKEFFSTGLNRTSGELLFGDELTYKLSNITSLRERWVIYPNLTESGEYRMQFDTSAVTNLRKWLGWQVTFSDRFLSNPVLGTKKNDVLFTTGLRLTFAR